MSPLIPTCMIDNPDRIPGCHQKHVIDAMERVTADLSDNSLVLPLVLQRWQCLLKGPVEILGIQGRSIQELDSWEIVKEQDPEVLSSVVRWGCTLATYTYAQLSPAGALLAEKGRTVVISALVLKVFQLLSTLPKVPADKLARAVAYQFLVATEHKCIITHRPFPLVDILDSLCKEAATEPAWRAKVEAAFPECMDKAKEFMEIVGFCEDSKKCLVRLLTIDLADVFLGSNDIRPTAQTCRNAGKLHRVLQLAAFKMSNDAPISMFAPILRRVHQDPAAEAEQFYALHHAKTAYLALARYVQLGDGEQELVECMTGWPQKASFALNPRSMAVLVAFMGGFTTQDAKNKNLVPPLSRQDPEDPYSDYMGTDSEQDEDEDEDEELTGGAVEEMRYWGVMGGGRGPVSLTQDQKKQQMEVLMKRPDLCRLIERCVVQQAGDGRPFALLRDLANLSLGPHNQDADDYLGCPTPAK